MLSYLRKKDVEVYTMKTFQDFYLEKLVDKVSFTSTGSFSFLYSEKIRTYHTPEEPAFFIQVLRYELDTVLEVTLIFNIEESSGRLEQIYSVVNGERHTPYPDVAFTFRNGKSIENSWNEMKTILKELPHLSRPNH